MSTSLLCNTLGTLESSLHCPVLENQPLVHLSTWQCPLTRGQARAPLTPEPAQAVGFQQAAHSPGASSQPWGIPMVLQSLELQQLPEVVPPAGSTFLPGQGVLGLPDQAQRQGTLQENTTNLLV